ncbi:MAG: peptidoglycan DD-metalloendopeptidase family protein [Calditrichia bacterium]
MTDEARAEMMSRLKERIAELRRDNKLTHLKKNAEVKYSWPVAVSPEIDAFAVHAVSNYVDHDNDSNSLQDYECGNRTYDSGSYDHKGTDYFSWPFSWYKMDNDHAQVVAAADGVIVEIYSGNDDRSCSLNGSQWNAIFVMHADTSVTWYGHMKENSLTNKDLGDSVSVGEYLGIIGSSGNSTGPHLHFEVYDGDNQLVDPYFGPCNELNDDTLWVEQRPYYDSAINALMTHSAPPVFPSCPNPETPNEKNIFLAGEEAFFAAYYRDHRRDQVSDFEILQPDGSVFQNWTHSPTRNFRSAAYYIWSFDMPSDAMQGTWIFRASFEGEVYEKTFEVPTLTGTGDDVVPVTSELVQNYPNPFNPETTIAYTVNRPGSVRLTIFNLLGEEIRQLVDVNQSSGRYSVKWDGRNNEGATVGSGVYLYRLETVELTETRRMTLVR